MIWFLFAAVGFVMYGVCRAVEAHGRRVEHDQASLVVQNPLDEGTP